MPKPKRLTLRQFNHALSVVVIVLCLYVLLAPLWPQVIYRAQKDPPLVTAEKERRSAPIPDQNTLVIPKMKLQQPIYESLDQSALGKGIWRHPQSSAPGQGKNTVLIGHRFTYGGPAVFYHLDKVRVGDRVVAYWNKKKYAYQVEKILIVPPTAIGIEQANVGEERLTIYTCTPLLTARDRLVIQAKPIEETP